MTSITFCQNWPLLSGEAYSPAHCRGIWRGGEHCSQSNNIITLLKEVSPTRCRVAPAQASPLARESPPHTHENCSTKARTIPLLSWLCYHDPSTCHGPHLLTHSRMRTTGTKPKRGVGCTPDPSTRFRRNWEWGQDPKPDHPGPKPRRRCRPCFALLF